MPAAIIPPQCLQSSGAALPAMLSLATAYQPITPPMNPLFLLVPKNTTHPMF